MKHSIPLTPKFWVKPLMLMLTLIVLRPLMVTAQDQSPVKALQAYADSIYGTNDFLVNGWKYFPSHYNAAGNPYFLGETWRTGSVTTHGKTFDNTALLYNLVTDELILKQHLNNGSLVYVVLNREFISSFLIGNHYFVNTTDLQTEKPIGGYIEMVYSGNFDFLIKYDKQFVKQYTQQFPNGSFSDQHSIRYLLQDGKLTRLQRKKALLNYFASHKKEIRSFLRKNKIRYKKADNSQLYQLMKFCDQL